MWLHLGLPTYPIIVWAIGFHWSTNHWWNGFWTFVWRVRLHLPGGWLVPQISTCNFVRGDIFWEVSPPDCLWHWILACVLFLSIRWRSYRMLWWLFCLVHLQLGVQKYSWCRNHMPQRNIDCCPGKSMGTPQWRLCIMCLFVCLPIKHNKRCFFCGLLSGMMSGVVEATHKSEDKPNTK